MSSESLDLFGGHTETVLARNPTQLLGSVCEPGWVATGGEDPRSAFRRRRR
jgi:hypothetical protein